MLHELRTGSSGVFDLRPWQPYFGSVDATPLFVVVLGETHRWGAPPERIRALLPAARAAVDWCRRTAARHDSGYLSYCEDTSGLRNQGWKDSADAMVHADGGQASGPIAVVEGQAYHWRALRELATFEQAFGNGNAASDLRAEAEILQHRVHRDFCKCANSARGEVIRPGR